jgi:hypothetical protein
MSEAGRQRPADCEEGPGNWSAAAVIEVDVAEVARLPAAIDRALAALGRLDILVNNADMEQVAVGGRVRAEEDRGGRSGPSRSWPASSPAMPALGRRAQSTVTGQILYVDGGYLASI